MGSNFLGILVRWTKTKRPTLTMTTTTTTTMVTIPRPPCLTTTTTSTTCGRGPCPPLQRHLPRPRTHSTARGRSRRPSWQARAPQAAVQQRAPPAAREAALRQSLPSGLGQRRSSLSTIMVETFTGKASGTTTPIITTAMARTSGLPRPLQWRQLMEVRRPVTTTTMVPLTMSQMPNAADTHDPRSTHILSIICSRLSRLHTCLQCPIDLTLECKIDDVEIYHEATFFFLEKRITCLINIMSEGRQGR